MTIYSFPPRSKGMLRQMWYIDLTIAQKVSVFFVNENILCIFFEFSYMKRLNMKIVSNKNSS